MSYSIQSLSMSCGVLCCVAISCKGVTNARLDATQPGTDALATDVMVIDGAPLDAAVDALVPDAPAGPFSQHTYIKASNTNAFDYFGWSVALSADGMTIAVGAYGEAGFVTGINGNQLNDACPNPCGAVYVFAWSGTAWSQQAYIKASNTGENDFFGYRVALSADGNTLAVNARWEDSAATGVGGNQADNTAGNSGAVYVFARSGTTWSQQAYVKASNTSAGDSFGSAIALAGDGNTLAVGAFEEDSDATGIGGKQTNDSAQDSGAVYVFTRSGTTWSQQAYIKASNTGVSDRFGASVALSGDGSILVAGAIGEASAAATIGGNQADNTAPGAGAVYVFTRANTTWTQQAYVKASNSEADDAFGFAVAISSDGSTFAVGAYGEDSAATGIAGDQTSNAAPSSGAVYMFRTSGTAWTQEAYVKASNTDQVDFFGSALAISSTGDTVAIGAPGNAGGAMYLVRRTGTAWTQVALLRSSGFDDYFAVSVAISGEGDSALGGAVYDDSAATGIDGSDGDEGAPSSGAAYLFR